MPGWSAYLQNMVAQEIWSRPKSRRSVNCLELCVIKRAIVVIKDHLESKPILIYMDKTSAKSYINRQDDKVLLASKRSLKILF